MRFQTPLWSLELAPGWRAEDRGDHCAVLNGDPHTALRLATFQPAGGLTAVTWVKMVARVHSPRGRMVTEVRCGDFRGVRTEFAVMATPALPLAFDRWQIAWALECEGRPLDVGYTCPLWQAVRDDADVRAMLDSLRAGPRVRDEA